MIIIGLQEDLQKISLSMHKTLQQTLIRTIVEVIKKVGEDDYPVDSRNKASHALCRKIISSGLLDKITLPLV